MQLMTSLILRCLTTLYQNAKKDVTLNGLSRRSGTVSGKEGVGKIREKTKTQIPDALSQS
jgi:hypothetical protein